MHFYKRYMMILSYSLWLMLIGASNYFLGPGPVCPDHHPHAGHHWGNLPAPACHCWDAFNKWVLIYTTYSLFFKLFFIQEKLRWPPSYSEKHPLWSPWVKNICVVLGKDKMGGGPPYWLWFSFVSVCDSPVLSLSLSFISLTEFVWI